MSKMFVVEDEMHAEICGEFSSYEEALTEARRRAAISWNESPNRCPCTGWELCGRNYQIVEYDATDEPWTRLATTPVLRVSASETSWLLDE